MSNKITIEQILSTMQPEKKVITYSINENDDIQIELQDNVSLSELSAISDQVTSTCIGNDYYHPEYKLPFMLYYVLEKMTNLSLPTKDGTIDLEQVFSIYKSPIGQTITSNWLTFPLIKHLSDSIDEKMKYAKEQLRIDYQVNDLIKYGLKTIQDMEDLITHTTNTINTAMESLDPKKQQESLDSMINALNEVSSDKLEFIKEAMAWNTGKVPNILSETNPTTDF